MPVYLLDKELSFPAPEDANEEGIVAVGGDVSPERLLVAYQQWHLSLACARLPAAVVLAGPAFRADALERSRLALAAQGRPKGAASSDRRHRFREVIDGLRGDATPAPTGHLDHARASARLPRASRARVRAQHRSLARRRAGGRPLWRGTRSDLRRRVDVRLGAGRLEGRVHDPARPLWPCGASASWTARCTPSTSRASAPRCGRASDSSPNGAPPWPSRASLAPWRSHPVA